MKMKWKIVLVAVLAVCLLGATGRDVTEAARAYFTSAVIAKIADEAVKAYEPPARWNNNQPTVCGSFDCGTFQAMRLVRWSIYDGHHGRDDKDIAAYKAVFLAAINEAGKDPAAVLAFYDQNADAFFSEVVKIARKRGYQYYSDKSQHFRRRSMSRNETAEMLSAYAAMAEGAVPYLRFAARPENDGFEARFAEIRYILDNNPHDYDWEVEDQIGKDMASLSNLPFDQGGLETWRFGRRRYKSSSELLQAMIEIAEDAAGRARAKARELSR